MSDLRMFLLAPTTVFAARVNMASATYPVSQLTFDGVTTGAYTDIAPNMTVLLSSSAGGDGLGRTRVRAVATSTVLPIGYSSEGTRDGELTIDDNAHITVLDDYRVWAKPHVIESDGDILKDGVTAYSDQNESPPPIVNVTPSAVAATIGGSNTITVEFDGTGSFVPSFADLIAIDTYAWDVADGTITVGTSASSAITATFPAGFRWVTLTITTDEAKSATRYVPVFARDPDDDDSIVAFQITNHIVRPNGQEISLRIYQDLPRATYPDGTLMLLWDGEPSDTDTNDNVLFVGWHHTDEESVQVGERAIVRDTTLTFQDVAGRLAHVPGFPTLIQYADPTTNWQETNRPTMDFYITYLLRWHSTGLEMGGLYRQDTDPALDSLGFAVMGSDQNNLYAQVNDMAHRITPDFALNCTRRGELYVAVDPMIQDTGDRTATDIETLTEADWSEMRWPYQRGPRVYQLQSYALNTWTSGPVIIMRSLAPGLAPGQGETYIETSERVASSQAALNVTEGNRYARYNARYGLFTIVLPYSRLAATFDLAYYQWVRLTLSEDIGGRRGLSMSGARGLVQEMTIRYDYDARGLARTAILQWERETSGPAAITMDV